MRRFVVVGRKATATGDFLLDDLPGTSGRLDVLLRCVRAATLTSHGLRPGVVVYLVLLGGPRAPRTVRIDTAHVRFLRPDERSLAVLLRKVLGAEVASSAGGAFVPVKPGVAVASGGLDAALADGPCAALFVLDPSGEDVRVAAELERDDAVFVLGDHLGLDGDAVATLAAAGARPVAVGPVAVHADDALAVLVNELDRRAPNGASGHNAPR